VDGRSALNLARLESARRFELGTSTAPGLRAGSLITIQDASGSRFDGAYYVTGVRHTFTPSGDDDDGCVLYGNLFRAIPAAVTYRPPRRTPAPIIHGPQTAVVTGPAGEEIYTDGLGRVKVQFHWDREGSTDENSSAWTFEHGDPHHPYVIGTLWNGAQPPPIALPGGRARSVLGSGHGAGANAIVFDDTQDAETLRLEAAGAGGLDLAAGVTSVAGTLRSRAAAGTAQRVATGDRFRDNAIVAWAAVSGAGVVNSEFGVSAVRQTNRGAYAIEIDARAATSRELIPVATAQVPLQPFGPAELRVASVIQEDQNVFEVFTNDGLGNPVDCDFVILVTAR
jgi:uncharacterized protein involved in type VI secretion and phage assembly